MSAVFKGLLLVVVLAAGAFVLRWAGYGILTGHSEGQGPPDSRSCTVSLNGGRASVDLGVLPPGEKATVVVRLVNPTTQPVRVSRVLSSCKCLQIALPPHEVAGGESAEVNAVVDLSEQPNYRGNLLLSADGVSADGHRLFMLTLDVSIR